jgi:hypothetical protein
VVAVSPDGERLATCGEGDRPFSGYAAVLDTSTSTRVLALHGHTDVV